MLQVILIYLRRFAWVFLPTCFLSVILVPFIINLLDMLWLPNLDHDYIYVFCAIVPCILALLYVFYCRHYVNREDLQMFVRHRIRCKKSFLVHYFTLSGVLVNLVFRRHIDPKMVDIYSVELLKEFAPNANIGPVLQRISGASNTKGFQFDDKAWADYAKLARYIGFIQTVEKEFGLDISLQAAMNDSEHRALHCQTLARKSFLKALSLSHEDAETQFVQELIFFKRVTRLYGHHVSDFLLTCLLRTLLYASRDPNQCQVEDLLTKLWVRKLGLAFTPNFEELSLNYSNEFFVTLYQERINIRQFFREHEGWTFADDEDNEDENQDASYQNSDFAQHSQGSQESDADGTFYNYENEIFFKHASTRAKSTTSTQDAKSRYSYALQLVQNKHDQAQSAQEQDSQDPAKPTVNPFHGYAYSFTAHLEPDAGNLSDESSQDLALKQETASAQAVSEASNRVEGDLAASLASVKENKLQESQGSPASLLQEQKQDSIISTVRDIVSTDSQSTILEGKVVTKESGSVEAGDATKPQEDDSAQPPLTLASADVEQTESKADSLEDFSSAESTSPSTLAQARAEARARIKSTPVPNALEVARAENFAAQRLAKRQEQRQLKLTAEMQHSMHMAVDESGLVVLDKQTSKEGVVNYTLGSKDGSKANSHIAYSFKAAPQSNESDTRTEDNDTFSLLHADDLASLDSNSAILTLDHKGNVTFISDEQSEPLDQEQQRKVRLFKNMQQPPQVTVKTGAGDGTHYSYRDSYRQAYEEAFATYQKLNQVKEQKSDKNIDSADKNASLRESLAPQDSQDSKSSSLFIKDKQEDAPTDSKDSADSANSASFDSTASVLLDLAANDLEVENELADLGNTPQQQAQSNQEMANQVKSEYSERIRHLFDAKREDMPWTHTAEHNTFESTSKDSKQEQNLALERAQMLEQVQSRVADSAVRNSSFVEAVPQGEMGGVLGVTDNGFYVGEMVVKGQGIKGSRVGKSPEELRKQAFAVLELDESASVEEIKAQYRGLAECYNPEVIHDYEGMSEHQKYLLYNRLMSIRDAYEYLMEQYGELV